MLDTRAKKGSISRSDNALISGVKKAQCHSEPVASGRRRARRSFSGSRPIEPQELASERTSDSTVRSPLSPHSGKTSTKISERSIMEVLSANPVVVQLESDAKICTGPN